MLPTLQNTRAYSGVHYMGIVCYNESPRQMARITSIMVAWILMPSVCWYNHVLHLHCSISSTNILFDDDSFAPITWSLAPCVIVHAMASFWMTTNHPCQSSHFKKKTYWHPSLTFKSCNNNVITVSWFVPSPITWPSHNNTCTLHLTCIEVVGSTKGYPHCKYHVDWPTKNCVDLGLEWGDTICASYDPWFCIETIRIVQKKLLRIIFITPTMFTTLNDPFYWVTSSHHVMKINAMSKSLVANCTTLSYAFTWQWLPKAHILSSTQVSRLQGFDKIIKSSFIWPYVVCISIIMYLSHY